MKTMKCTTTSRISLSSSRDKPKFHQLTVVWEPVVPDHANWSRFEWSRSEIIFGAFLLWTKIQYSNVFLGFLGTFIIIMQNDTILLHMLKIKGEKFELLVLQQFATPQNLLCKLEMAVLLPWRRPCCPGGPAALKAKLKGCCSSKKFKKFQKYFENVLKIFWKRSKNILKTF